MKIFKVTVRAKTGKIVNTFPRIYLHPQGISAVKGYWLSRHRLETYEKFSAPYTVDVQRADVPDEAWH